MSANELPQVPMMQSAPPAQPAGEAGSRAPRGALGAGAVACPPLMPPVAIVTDSTHYLPPAMVREQGISQVSLYVGWHGESQRELDLGGFDDFYARLADDSDLPT